MPFQGRIKWMSVSRCVCTYSGMNRLITAYVVDTSACPKRQAVFSLREIGNRRGKMIDAVFRHMWAWCNWQHTGLPNRRRRIVSGCPLSAVLAQRQRS